jgi:hypothetical protein
VILRGPPGIAPAPPSWLATTTLPLDRLAAGTVFYRVHRSAFNPVFYGPGRGNPPTYRFDSQSGAFGLLYLGFALAAALVETLLRNPDHRLVDYGEIEDRSSSELRCPTDLRVVQMYGTGISQLGTDNAISTGPYDVCGLWADELWNHPDAPDGIAYQSRHDPAQLCLALFERPGQVLTSIRTIPLTSQIGNVTRILRGYGKQIIRKSP